MRHAALAAAVAILGACGSSGTSHGLNTAPTFSLNGVTYTPKDGGGLAVNNKSCTVSLMGLPPVTLNWSALVAGFSSFDGICTFVQANSVCASKQSSQIGQLAIIKGSSAPPGPIGTGTYTIGESFDQTTGYASIVYLSFANLNATCTDTAGYNSAVAKNVTGTVTIDAVLPTVKGSIDAKLMNGTTQVGSISGPFEVNTCNANVDICGELAGTCTNTCVM